jgi:hypothetical protein
MRALLLLAGVVLLTVASFGGSGTSSATAGQGPSIVSIGRANTIWHLRLPFLGRVSVLPNSVDAQATSTAPGTTSPTPTGTATPPTPTVTATSTFPDPVSILQNMFSIYQLVRSASYELKTSEDHPGVEKAILDAKGDLTCKNSAINGRLQVSDVVEGTNQSTNINEIFTQIKKAVFVKSKKTHNVWAKGKPHEIDQYGITVTNLLFCPAGTSSSGGGSSGSNNTTIKDLVNQGPDKFQGVAVWRIHATEVMVDQNGNTTNASIDFLIGQDHFLPYEFTYTYDDPVNMINTVQTQILTNFGKKVKITKPVIGSKKP